MEGLILVIGTITLICIIIIVVCLVFIRKKEQKKYIDIANQLEISKNKITSTPVLLELSKLEPIIKNELMEDKYNKWNNRFIYIKENKISKIDDILIDLDLYIENRKYKECNSNIAKAEISIYQARESAEHLLEEIKEITLSEEKYRGIVIKLKTKYRQINRDYQRHKNMYDDMQEVIELQLENIEKNFLDFEKVMDKNEYSEVVKVVKALDNMIDHMGIVIEEIPDILLMSKQLIPKKIKEIKETVKDMTNNGYPLDYLNIDYNIEESEKNIEKILAKVKILNLEECMFELKTILNYLDSLFIDFEKERLSRKVYEDVQIGFNNKLEKTNKVVDDIYNQLSDIKSMYDLNEDDIKTIHDVKKTLVIINDDYKNMLGKVNALSIPYSVLHKDIEVLTERLKKMEEDLDIALKSLGNMHDDEERAKEQLEEIENFLQESKNKMRSYKLPVIVDNYFIELKEANEAIEEVVKELEKKPIVIKTLNTRVDTARDLVLKLYNTTNKMIKTAMLAEKSIVYCNRYKPYYNEVADGIDEAENYFYKGNYNESLDVVLKTCSLVDENIYKKLLSVYDK